MFQFIRPYRWHVLGALFALIFTAVLTLSLGQGLRMLVDRGFGEGGGMFHTPTLP